MGFPVVPLNNLRELFMDKDSIFGEVPTEGQSIEEVLDAVDKEQEVEKPVDSLPEKLELPDESILKKNSAWEEMRTAREEAEAKAQELEARLSALEKPDSLEKNDFVKSLVGENEDVEEKWAKEKESLKEEMKRELIQDQLDAQQKEQEQKEHWMNWTNDRLSEVEKEFNVDFKADESKKNELSKIMLEWSPTDEQGNLDYRKGMKILNELDKIKVTEKHASTQVKKDIADATVSKETSVQQNKGYLTSQDLRGKDWRTAVNQD